MGGMLGILDSCAGGDYNSPAAFMDAEYERESRIKIHNKRRKMDVMGVAMEMAVGDIKKIVGMYSDNEEQTQEDVDY